MFGDAGRGIPPIGGDAASTITEAQAKRWQLKNEAQARATTFIQEMAIKNIAPWVYQTRKYLQALTESVAGPRPTNLSRSSRGTECERCPRSYVR